MQPFPHIYQVVARGTPIGDVSVEASAAPTLLTAPPKEFDGSGNAWSPESLLCAAVADCFIFTFRAVARASRFEWQEIQCRVEGKLERIEGRLLFTHFTTYAAIKVGVGADNEQAMRLLEKAEHDCLIANSLNAGRSLDASVVEQIDPLREAAAQAIE